MTRKTIKQLECNRCGHTWYPATPKKPLTCANQNCRSAYYDKPRVRKRKGVEN